MGTEVLKNVKLYSGQYDLSGDTNRLALTPTVEMLEDTAFGDTFRSRIPGLQDVSVDFDGWWDAAQPDSHLHAQIGLGADNPETVLTVGPQTGAEGELAYFLQRITTSYAPGAAVGEVFAFSVTGQGVGPLIKGNFLEAKSAKTVTGVGTARNLGAVSASQYLYGALHVFALAGTNPTLDMVIQSDDAQGFVSPTARITFAQMTALGAKWATPVTGPITDTWWRASWTIGGTAGPSFTVVVVMGIK